MKRKIALFVLSSNLLLASGYKIPEQSLNSFALSAAYAANANGADAAPGTTIERYSTVMTLPLSFP